MDMPTSAHYLPAIIRSCLSLFIFFAMLLELFLQAGQRVSTKQLNSLLNGALNGSALSALLRTHQHQLDEIHLATAFKTAAKVCRPREAGVR